MISADYCSFLFVPFVPFVVNRLPWLAKIRKQLSSYWPPTLLPSHLATEHKFTQRERRLFWCDRSTCAPTEKLKGEIGNCPEYRGRDLDSTYLPPKPLVPAPTISRLPILPQLK